MEVRRVKRAPYGHRHGNRHASESVLSKTVARWRLRGKFTIYGKYMLVLECLRIAGLKLYLRIFKSKPFPLRRTRILGSRHWWLRTTDAKREDDSDRD